MKDIAVFPRWFLVILLLAPASCTFNGQADSQSIRPDIEDGRTLISVAKNAVLSPAYANERITKHFGSRVMTAVAPTTAGSRSGFFYARSSCRKNEPIGQPSDPTYVTVNP